MYRTTKVFDILLFNGSYTQEQNYPFSFVFPYIGFFFLISTAVRNVNFYIYNFCFITMKYAILNNKKTQTNCTQNRYVDKIFLKRFFLQVLINIDDLI